MRHWGRRAALAQAHGQPEFHRPVIFSEREDRPLVLADAGDRHGLHRANDTLKFPSGGNLPGNAFRRTAHFAGLDSGGPAPGAALTAAPGLPGTLAGTGGPPSSGAGAGPNGASARVARSRMTFLSSSLSLSAVVRRPITSADMRPAA